MSANLLSDAQKFAIADITIASTDLDLEVERCIIELCKLQWLHGVVLLENVSVAAKLDMFQQLLQIEFHSSKIPDGFVFVNQNLKDLNAQRNTIVHGQWMTRSFASGDWEKVILNSRREIEQKDIVAQRKKRGKKPPPIAAKDIAKVSELMDLNRELLHQLFWEHFPFRVSGLAGVQKLPAVSSLQRQEIIRKRKQKL